MKKINSIATILIIDDEKGVLKVLRDTLEQENFVVHTRELGNEGIKAVTKVKPDLVLLDLRLPDMDGFDVCRALKQNEETRSIPVIILSTRSKDVEKVVGLEMGADDYITKPYSPYELVARIRMVLRRRVIDSSQNQEVDSLIIQGPVRVDKELRKVIVSNRPVKLTPKEYDLLVLLMTKPGKPYTRQAIMSIIWGEAYENLQGTVDSHIKNLRKKLGAPGSFIETITGIGYRWAEPNA